MQVLFWPLGHHKLKKINQSNSGFVLADFNHSSEGISMDNEWGCKGGVHKDLGLQQLNISPTILPLAALPCNNKQDKHIVHMTQN